MADYADGTGSLAKIAGFDWQDPFLLDDQLTEEERLVRDTARGYAQVQAAPPRHLRLSGRAVRP